MYNYIFLQNINRYEYMISITFYMHTYTNIINLYFNNIGIFNEYTYIKKK